jgi:hypothetical protein
MFLCSLFLSFSAFAQCRSAVSLRRKCSRGRTPRLTRRRLSSTRRRACKHTIIQNWNKRHTAEQELKLCICTVCSVASTAAAQSTTSYSVVYQPLFLSRRLPLHSMHSLLRDQLQLLRAPSTVPRERRLHGHLPRRQMHLHQFRRPGVSLPTNQVLFQHEAVI